MTKIYDDIETGNAAIMIQRMHYIGGVHDGEVEEIERDADFVTDSLAMWLEDAENGTNGFDPNTLIKDNAFEFSVIRSIKNGGYKVQYVFEFIR